MFSVFVQKKKKSMAAEKQSETAEERKGALGKARQPLVHGQDSRLTFNTATQKMVIS